MSLEELGRFSADFVDEAGGEGAWGGAGLFPAFDEFDGDSDELGEDGLADARAGTHDP